MWNESVRKQISSHGYFCDEREKKLRMNYYLLVMLYLRWAMHTYALVMLYLIDCLRFHNLKKKGVRKGCGVFKLGVQDF